MIKNCYRKQISPRKFQEISANAIDISKKRINISKLPSLNIANDFSNLIIQSWI